MGCDESWRWASDPENTADNRRHASSSMHATLAWQLLLEANTGLRTSEVPGLIPTYAGFSVAEDALAVFLAAVTVTICLYAFRTKRFADVSLRLLQQHWLHGCFTDLLGESFRRKCRGYPPNLRLDAVRRMAKHAARLKRFNLLCIVGLVVLAALLTPKTQASPVVFFLDSSQSTLTMFGNVGGDSFSYQGIGGLTTVYDGYINADLTSSNIFFPGGSFIRALTNGIWQPGAGGGIGSAPADYGVSGINSFNTPFSRFYYGAFRNIVLDVGSGLLPITGSFFDDGQLYFSLATNTAAFDYNCPDLGKSGSAPLTSGSVNLMANSHDLYTNGVVRTLFIDIKLQFTYYVPSAGQSTITLTGQLVATNILALPTIQSVVKTNDSLVVTANNASPGSQLLVSTDLVTWLPANATTTTNASGSVLFTTPMNGSSGFFRVQQ
jgi:hypothetical protein